MNETASETRTAKGVRRRVLLSVLFVLGLAASVAVLLGIARTVQKAWAIKNVQELLAPLPVAFRRYANENREYLPPRAPIANKFLPDMDRLAPYLLDSPEGARLVSYLTGPGGDDFCYLGHMVMNEEGALALLDEYEQWGIEAFRETNITLDIPTYDGRLYAPEPTVYRLREGIERLLVEPFPPAPEVARARASIPVLWQMPDRNPWGGGLVLDFDGHFEWKPYPGEFPMTERFIRRVRGIMETAPSTRSDRGFILGQLEIRGRVTGPDGQPLEGVRVFVHDPRTKDTGEWAHTDEKGRYMVSGLSDASYNLYVTEREHKTARRWDVAGGSADVDFCLIPVELQTSIR